MLVTHEKPKMSLILSFLTRAGQYVLLNRYIPFRKKKKKSSNIRKKKNKAVVFSEGMLYLDDCDFSGSKAATLVSVLVSTTTEAEWMIR